jgi:hypothetical protein
MTLETRRCKSSVDVLFCWTRRAAWRTRSPATEQHPGDFGADPRARNIDVRYGRSYRDRGDAYITQTFDFVPDVTAFQSSLSGVVADAGGDTPESLNEALHTALNNVTWRGDDTVKLVFLVADAAPHLDYPNDYDYSQEMAVAAQRGIKIHPIASSGLTPDGEFIFRQIAQYTMGHFIFLTYEQGASGAPGDTRPDLHVGDPSKPEQQQEGDYTVQQLDKLVLRLIQDELAALTRRVESSAGPEVAVSLLALPPAQGSPPPDGPFEPRDDLGSFLKVVMAVLLVVVGCSMALGYLLRGRRPPDKPKRKNDQRPATLAALVNGEWEEE